MHESRRGRSLGPLDPKLGPEMTVWAERLREFYASLGLTLLRLEGLLGVDASTLSRYLKGQRLPEIGFLDKLDEAVHSRTGSRLRAEVKAAVRAECLAACLVHEPQRHEVYVLRDELEEARVRLTAAEQTVAELRDQIAEEQRRREELLAGLLGLEGAVAGALRDAQEVRRERDMALAERDRLGELVREHLAELELARRDHAISSRIHREVDRSLTAAEQALDDELALHEDAADWTGAAVTEAAQDPSTQPASPHDHPLARWWRRASSGDLAKLREATAQAAHVYLPELVERLAVSGPHDVDPPVRSVGSYANPEVGQLASAIDSLIREAVRLAAEQALLRGNVNLMFTSLSRRSQGLVHRQLALLSELESREDDPGRLSAISKVDHYATRMRRNASSLLVIAGDRPDRRRSAHPVALVDVLRAAASEVEWYERIELEAVSTIDISGRAVNDLVHLLAELLENATAFSSPQTRVRVLGTVLPDGRVLVEIHDSGIGLPPDQLGEINERLATPPVVSVHVSRRMGLFVAARLSQRHGIRITLRPSDTGGTTALVMIPEDVPARA
ncbi:ATP-binding protein [Streptomyces sp. NPDC085481]|uniref:sensor histidine kinase n=1 Tax=Streptomyces sp. NPDC085481 TaxID=3365727 RepID=UPI0037D30C3B